MNVMLCLV